MSNPYLGDWQLLQTYPEMNYYTAGDPLNYYSYYPTPHAPHLGYPIPIVYTEPEIPNVYLSPSQSRSTPDSVNGAVGPPKPVKIPACLTDAKPRKEIKKELDYDEEYDKEISEMLDDMTDRFEDVKDLLETILKSENACMPTVPFCSNPLDFSDDSDCGEPVPQWYDELLSKKIKETKARLSDLSNVLCYSCASTREYLIRTESDHNTPFCKLNSPRYRSLRRPWINRWKFNCVTKCGEDNPPPFHAHTQECQTTVLEHQFSNVGRKTSKVLENEFPKFLMKIVGVIEDFINKYTPDAGSILEDGEVLEVGFEYPEWQWVSIRCNFKNEVMLVFCGKNVQNVTEIMKDFFMSESRKYLKISSVYCINNKWSTKKGPVPPQYICGRGDLIDKVGSVLVKYTSKNLPWFNAVETELLGRAICEFLNPTPETTVLDIGCGVGVISNMLAQRSDKVIGLTPNDFEVKAAEECSAFNKIHNASFLLCKPGEVHLKIPALLKSCKSVAVFRQDSHFGKKDDVIRNLRNLPTLCRVVVHGTFKKEFQKQVCLMVKKDLHLGDPFLPIQGCIVDKSVKNVDEFDIVILFERKNMIYYNPGAPGDSKDFSKPLINSLRTGIEKKDSRSNSPQVSSDHSSCNPSRKPSPKTPSPPTMSIKREPGEMFYEDRNPKHGKDVKEEPMEMASPISDTNDDILMDDISNVETPKRNPYASQMSFSPSRSQASKKSNFDDFGFDVKTQESFLNSKKKEAKERREKKPTNDDLRDLLQKKKHLQHQIDEDPPYIKKDKYRDKDRGADRERDWDRGHGTFRSDSRSYRDRPYRKRKSRTPSLSPPSSTSKHYRRKSPICVDLDESDDWDIPSRSKFEEDWKSRRDREHHRSRDHKKERDAHRDKLHKKSKKTEFREKTYRTEMDGSREMDHRRERENSRDKDSRRERETSREREARRERRVVRQIKVENELSAERETSPVKEKLEEIKKTPDIESPQEGEIENEEEKDEKSPSGSHSTEI